MANVQEMFRLLCPSSVVHEINGQEITFYQCSVGACSKLHGFIAEMAGHISVLLSGQKGRDEGRTEEDCTDAESGMIVQRTIISPINPDLAKLRTDQRSRAVKHAITELMSDKNRAAVGELLMDSLKDNFPRRRSRTADECREFIDQMDLSTFIQFLVGLAKANAKVFGDLGKDVVRAAQARANELLGAKDAEQEASDPEMDGSTSETTSSS